MKVVAGAQWLASGRVGQPSKKTAHAVNGNRMETTNGRRQAVGESLNSGGYSIVPHKEKKTILLCRPALPHRGARRGGRAAASRRRHASGRSAGTGRCPPKTEPKANRHRPKS